jgi:hypothetical protein
MRVSRIRQQYPVGSEIMNERASSHVRFYALAIGRRWERNWPKIDVFDHPHKQVKHPVKSRVPAPRLGRVFGQVMSGPFSGDLLPYLEIARCRPGRGCVHDAYETFGTFVRFDLITSKPVQASERRRPYVGERSLGGIDITSTHMA